MTTLWQRMGIILPNENNKDHTLFPTQIAGRYVLLHRRPPDIWIAYSNDLLNWTDHHVVMHSRPGTWEHLKIGAGGPPIRTDSGWLLIYHAVDEHRVYRLGAALLDLHDPSQVIARLPYPILEPQETWEVKGDVPNVVFTCANVVVDGTLYVFYGDADRTMGLAVCALDELLNALREHSLEGQSS